MNFLTQLLKFSLVLKRCDRRIIYTRIYLINVNVDRLNIMEMLDGIDKHFTTRLAMTPTCEFIKKSSKFWEQAAVLLAYPLGRACIRPLVYTENMFLK